MGFTIGSRFYAFSKEHNLTFDEGLYSNQLAKQLRRDVFNYSTERFYNLALEIGKKPPDYLNRPIFKHPPMFPYLIAFAYSMFGENNTVAVGVSIFMGLFMVLAAFFFGRAIYDYRVGLLAAFFLSIDPFNWICSQKIWMETTLAFFVFSAVMLFSVGENKN